MLVVALCELLLKGTQRSDDRSAKFLISLWFVSKLLNLGFLCIFFFAAFFAAAVASEAEVGFLFTLSFTTIFLQKNKKKVKLTFLIKSWDMTEARLVFLYSILSFSILEKY